ncbi:MAG: phage tail tape measure protein [Rhizobiales bacterium 63-22]|nr:MAG: phage tail tape measure protein [Rhizobiales bacterium 63-22]
MAVMTSTLILSLIDRVTAPARGIEATLKRLQNAQANNTRRLNEVRGQMMDAVGAAYALYKGLSAPLNAAAKFEGVMLDIAQKADLSNAAMGALGKGIRQLSADLGKGPGEIAAGIDDLMGKGLDAKSAQEAITPITKVATAYKAAVDDVASASFSVMDNMKVPARELGKSLDIMSQAGKEGAFELKDMARYFPQLTARAQALGMTGTVGVARLAAMLQIARKGAGSAEEAATNAANVMQKIISPQTTKAFKKHGIDIRKELKKTQKAGGDIFEMLAEQTMKATHGDLSKLGDIFQDAQVQAGMIALIQNLKEYQRIRDASANAKGVVDADFIRRQQTGEQAMERFGAAMERIGITIGSALLPALNKLTDATEPVINRMADFTEAHPKLTQAIVATTAALIALRVAAIAAQFSLLWMRGGALSVLIRGFGLLNGAVLAAQRSIGATIALQTALAGGARYGMFAKFIDGGKALLAIIPGLSLIEPIMAGIGAAVAAVGGTVAGVIVAVVAAVVAAAVVIWKYWDRISSIFSGVARAIGEQLAPAIATVRPYLEWLVPIGSAIASGWESAMGALQSFGSWIASFFSREVLTDAQKAAWEQSGYDAATRLIEAVKSKVGELVDWFRSLPGKIVAAIGNIDISGLIKWPSMPSWLGGGGGGGGSIRDRAANNNAGATIPLPGVAGARAAGGPVVGGRTYLVGEKGPELFTAGRSGTIIPNGGTSSLGGGSFTIGALHVHGVPGMSEESLAQKVVAEMERRFRAAMDGAQADLEYAVS